MDMNLMLVNTYMSIWTIGLYEQHIGSRIDWNRIHLVKTKKTSMYFKIIIVLSTYKIQYI